MPFKKLFSGSKSGESSPYPAQNYGVASQLSPMFRPSSSSPPTGQSWQAPNPQGQQLSGLQSQTYFPPPPGWQAPIPPRQSYSPAPGTYYSPPAQYQMNNVAYAPQHPPVVNQAMAAPAWSMAMPVDDQVRSSTLFPTHCTDGTSASDQAWTHYLSYPATNTTTDTIFTASKCRNSASLVRIYSSSCG